MSNTPVRVAAVVLAAGQSRRFGSDKRAHRLPGGQTLLHRVVERVQQAVDGVILVLKPEDEGLWAFPPCDSLKIVYASEHGKGMGHSLSAGVHAMMQDSFEACLVVLADMPTIEVSSYKALAEALRAGASIVQPVFNGLKGNPAGFNQRWYSQLLRSQGDQGAKQFIVKNIGEVSFIHLNDPGVLLDIDTPQSIQSLG